ncbi:MAG: hypothetical protein ACRC8C_01440 [Mycoplasmoidaceae bacterium]
MSYYKQPIYKITDHVKQRFQERNKENNKEKLSFSEVEVILQKMLENSYDGEKLENGDRKLITFDCPSTYFIVTKDNIVKTFIKNK